MTLPFQDNTLPSDPIDNDDGLNSEVIESVVFHPVDQIHSSISSWILTTAIDFDPYKDALFDINQYALKVKQSFTRYSESFQSDDLRYPSLLTMTMDDINSVLYEITSTQIEMLNLIDNIHRPQEFRMKKIFITLRWTISFLIWDCKR